MYKGGCARRAYETQSEALGLVFEACKLSENVVGLIGLIEGGW